VMRETLGGFQGGLQIGGRMITNLRYADDIILLATSEAELQEFLDRLDRVSRKYSLLINVDKTKVMACDGIACRILIQNKLLEQADTFPYLGSLITEDGECTTEFRTRLNKGQAIETSLQKMLRVSWTAKKTNELVLNKAGVKRELLDTVKARKLAYYGHTMRKQGSCLEKEKMQQTMPGAQRRGRSRTAWMDNIKTWTGLSVEESIRDKWRKYVHGVANPRIEDG